MTHNDSASIAACVAFTRILWEALGADRPTFGRWHQLFVAAARELECDDGYRCRSPEYATFVGPMWRFVEAEVGKALTQALPVRQACDRWYSGAYLLETVPCVLYIVDRCGADPEEALVRAVNDTRDNDTVAAIVGAFVGALHGA